VIRSTHVIQALRVDCSFELLRSPISFTRLFQLHPVRQPREVSGPWIRARCYRSVKCFPAKIQLKLEVVRIEACIFLCTQVTPHEAGQALLVETSVIEQSAKLRSQFRLNVTG
jgi:hypothetical protein